MLLLHPLLICQPHIASLIYHLLQFSGQGDIKGEDQGEDHLMNVATPPDLFKVLHRIHSSSHHLPACSVNVLTAAKSFWHEEPCPAQVPPNPNIFKSGFISAKVARGWKAVYWVSNIPCVIICPIKPYSFSQGFPVACGWWDQQNSRGAVGPFLPFLPLNTDHKVAFGVESNPSQTNTATFAWQLPPGLAERLHLPHMNRNAPT